jgi:hypothetical protein
VRLLHASLVRVDLLLSDAGENPYHSSSVSRTQSAITAESSSMANVTVRANPCGPVMRTRTPPLNGSVAIHASCGALTCSLPSDQGRLDACAEPGSAHDLISALDPLFGSTPNYRQLSQSTSGQMVLTASC